MDAWSQYAINERFYQWSVRAFRFLRNRLGLKITAHAEAGVVEGGQIFLFNHFARFETIIPQYFIYEASGAYCRCVATHELFDGNERFAKVLRGVGAVPSNSPGLLAFLAAEILRGQKVMIFPEGGMMKDRSIAAPADVGFVQSLRSRRGHHQGATALAVILAVFKKRILSVAEAGNAARLERWVKTLDMKNQEALIAAARKPTLIVPSNITFYPLHSGENILLRAANLLKFKLSQSGRDELQVEGNLLLRSTDMDIRFGKPINPEFSWTWAGRLGLARSFEQIDSLDELFGLRDKASAWSERLATLVLKTAMRRLRDQCMVEMYANVTLNINHLASAMILRLAKLKRHEISQADFHQALHDLILTIQKQPGLHLHRSISDPDFYVGLIANQTSALDDFFKSAENMGLLSVADMKITLLPDVVAPLGKRDPRLSNIIRVYANEIGSLTNVARLVDEAVAAIGG